MNRIVCLKVKLKSLAVEARMIKFEEQKRKVPRHRRRSHGKIVNTQVIQHQKIAREDSRIRRRNRAGKSWFPMSLMQLQMLQRHRLDVVRVEARLTTIAYGYLRGRTFASIDSGRGLKDKDWERIDRMVREYGDHNPICMLPNGELVGLPGWAAYVEPEVKAA